MRFINRDSMPPPDILFSKRAEEARGEVQAFMGETVTKGETRRLPDNSWLDEDDGFKNEMEKHFSGVCAYCEKETRNRTLSSKPSFIGRPDGVIGRHRPEALAQDEEGHTDFLAYAWLASDWENLLWICSTCKRNKGNRFYVEGPRGSVFTSVEDLRKTEQELLIDPCFHDPNDHLSFRLDGLVDWKSPAGHATIEVLDLNRAQLVSERKAAIYNLALRIEEKYAQAFGMDGTPSYLTADVLTGSPQNAIVPPPHCGAATQAILSFAQYRGMKVDTAEHFLDLVYRLPGDDFRAFLGDMAAQFDDASAQEPPVIHADFEALSQPKPTRIPNIQTLPNALKPITRVEISNFKALREIAFDLPDTVDDPEQSPCMLLLGENATGKSSVLEAMALAILGAEETAALDALVDDTPLTPNGLIHRPDPSDWATTMDAVRVTLSFLDATAPVSLHGSGKATTFEGAEVCAKVILGYGPRRFFTSRKSRRLRAPAHRVKSMFDPLDVIANPIHWLTNLPDPQFFAAARALREILMLARDDDFERDDTRIYIRQGAQRVAMQDLSVGFKSIIAMTCDIIREMLYHFDNLEFASAVVFIDEIETHLHPRWKMQIMTLLRRAFPKIQFIVTTHDPLCLRGMYDGEVFVLHRADDTDFVERVEDLPSIRGMRAEQILTSEFFGLGSTDPETDARLMRYNRLAARIEDLSATEHDEMARLRTQLDDGMVIGTTLREQAYAEALKDRVTRHTVAPTRAPSPRRARLKSEFSNLFNPRSG